MSRSQYRTCRSQAVCAIGVGEYCGITFDHRDVITTHLIGGRGRNPINCVEAQVPVIEPCRQAMINSAFVRHPGLELA
jgi:hypothetical protein